MSAQTQQKIFGIGFQKTGTSSLNEALAILGYRAGGGLRLNHPKGVYIPPPFTNETVMAVARKRALEADAHNDNPWPLLYREMDAEFPGAKFILTVRDTDRWIAKHGAPFRRYAERSDAMDLRRSPRQRKRAALPRRLCGA